MAPGHEVDEELSERLEGDDGVRTDGGEHVGQAQKGGRRHGGVVKLLQVRLFGEFS